MSRRKLVEVGLVGRRNVGKSTLFNSLLGKNRAITDPIPGLTRDILRAEILRPPYHFYLSDTPGLDIEDPGQLENDILERAKRHLEKVDLLILLLEAPAPESFDHYYIDLIRKAEITTPTLFVVNKVDGAEQQYDALAAFYETGLTDPVAISAKTRWNINHLLERLAELNPDIKREDAAQILEQRHRAILDAEMARRQKKEVPEQSEIPSEEEDAELSAQSGEDTSDLYGNEEDEDDGDGMEVIYAGSSGLDVSYIEYDTKALESLENLDPESREFQKLAGEFEKSLTTTKTRKDTGRHHSSRRPKVDSTIFSDSLPTDTRVAIVGRTNVGKSSLLNKLVAKEVSLVSDIPGTTRDAVDTVFQYHGKTVRIIDTAGMRRVNRLKGVTKDVEFYSISRTRRAIQDSRIVIHMLDATMGVTDFDKKISAAIVEKRRPLILAINKWDLIEDKQTNTVKDYISKIHTLFPHAERFPKVFISAQSGQRIGKLMDMVLELDEKMRFRISTPRLNKLLNVWNRYLKNFGQNARILYAAQADAEPPVFIFFVRNKASIRKDHLAYFENRLREEFDLEGLPLSIFLRER